MNYRSDYLQSSLNGHSNTTLSENTCLRILSVKNKFIFLSEYLSTDLTRHQALFKREKNKRAAKLVSLFFSNYQML